MRVRPKDVIVLRLPPDEARGSLELLVRLQERGAGDWLATVRGEDVELGLEGRVFRDRDRAVAAGKMVRWLRGRFPEASVVPSGATTPRT